MKVNVLFEIHTLVSRVTVFDKIRKNPYLQKSPYLTLFESKINSIHLVSSKFISLSLIQSFETNSIHFGHKLQLDLLIMLNLHLSQLISLNHD